MAPALSPSQVDIIKATVPVVAEHGLTITTKFYADMLAANPSLKNIFNQTHQATGHQPQALAGALYAYAANIDALGNLSPALELICHKHASLYIRPEQYDIVGKHLLETMKTVLGDAATADIMDAWAAAYKQSADVMIQKEGGLYKETSYWDDWKDFKIAKKEQESEEITSFYFEPVDQGFKSPVYKPGQYISVNLFVDELQGGIWQARQYSLSDAPGKGYSRISVKKEPGVEIGEPKSMMHPGYSSNISHDKKSVGDVVKMSHPFGDFFFEASEADKDSPVVFIAAGVGLTCLMSILNTLAEAGESTRPVTWIHGARNSDTRAFKKHVNRLAASKKNLQPVYFNTHPKSGEAEGQDYDIKGRIDSDKIGREKSFTNNNRTKYFVCGPTQFMLDVESKSNGYGVPSERIKMESYGTGGVPRV